MWINVKDKLPECGQYVAVIHDGHVYMARFEGGKFIEQCSGCGCCSDFRTSKVLLWCELPEISIYDVW
jgi:hypothetical protein